ncbi:MAG TPA: hypothetical protein DDZ88_11540 [Verrucomicrobiales bacterium]|nr:hypothetical protein [Verrucomicrobiales bacterium]
MKSTHLSHAAAVLALALSLPAAAQEKPQEPVVPTEIVELNGFGSDEPVERADEPTRGVIKVSLEELQHMPAAHWEQYDCTKFTAKRWGKYEVRLTYTLRHANLGSQFRFGDKSLKKNLTASSQPRTAVYGEVYIEKPGTYPFVLYIAATGAESGLKIQEITFVPAPEGPAPEPAADGSLVLEAKSATTWSETMRYEPKAEKNCLGFWSDENDFAEWNFDIAKPGRYKVAVVHGCASGNEGSEVAVKHNGQELKFTTQDTGGFQKWKEVSVGEIEIKTAGPQRLVIDPVNKVKTAVLDVHKVVLTPAG